MTFLDTISIPVSFARSDSADKAIQAFRSPILQMENPGDGARLEAIVMHPNGKALLDFIFAHSPFLTRLTTRHGNFFMQLCEEGPDALFSALASSSLSVAMPHNADELMKALRILKAKAALLIAIADITSVWALEQVTTAMSEVAEICVRQALRFLLTQAARKGSVTLSSADEPEHACGLFVLAMGKLGAHELNYSSDIDLIVFFERERVQCAEPGSLEKIFSKLTQELVRLLQERTADGYVFRVDLRLRPDPASTPAAMSTAGALTYYETVGQNWERAALIKARAIAGDREAAGHFLTQLLPFIWRKHLDFAAIADIQSIKRQMDARSGGAIELGGHNIKTGIGGIREIEFFGQIHQLIWGGRKPEIRIAGTCNVLARLADVKLITSGVARRLTQSYHFLRQVEHRLQMIDDQQTHSIPSVVEAQQQLASFLGYPDLETFRQVLIEHLQLVHTHFSEVFQGQGSLGSDAGTLSFTGVENDPRTLETLRKMGFENPASISEVIQGWHRGARRATRTKRARELITELTPTLLKRLAATSQPDQAFMHFDTFLTHLPAGVQLFSLFYSNPGLLDLIALIMGSAPAMAESLSKNSSLLDSVLASDFYLALPQKSALQSELTLQLVQARDFEDEMDILRRFKNEKQFQGGVQLIRHQVTARQVGDYLSDIADCCVSTLLARVENAMSAKYPDLVSGVFAIIALGRLGAHELTFGSDIDLVFVYDAEVAGASQHALYNKLGSRLIGALTALTHEGRLYEVDTRLRPSGGDGALAVGEAAFDLYFTESAWTFEFMALTRARVISGNEALRNRVEQNIRKHILREPSARVLARDILNLREKITRESGSDDPWNLKYTHGGIIDLNFLAQYLLLCHAHAAPEIWHASSGKVFRALAERKLMDATLAATLEEAHYFMGALFALLRLCGGGKFDEATAPQGLRELMAKSLKKDNFELVKSTLLTTLQTVKAAFAAHLSHGLGSSQPA